MAKINILFIENGVSGGGSFESLFQLVTHIDPEWFHPVVVFVNKTVFYSRLKEKNIDTVLITDLVYSIHSNSFLRRLILKLYGLIEKYSPFLGPYFERLVHFPAITSLKRLTEKYEIDLIHLNNQIIRDFYGAILSQQTRIPCISYLRSSRKETANPLKIDFLNNHVSRFITNSFFSQDYWISLGIPRNKITTVHNAIDFPRVESLDIRREWDISNRFKFIVGCVAQLRPPSFVSKGHEFLITAFKHVLAIEPDCLLMIIGDGENKQELVNLSRQMGIQNSVLFTGYDPRPKEIIKALDVLVLPSLRETFGRTLLEAMLVRTPIVATRSGGIPEVIQHEYSGLLVDYDDIDGLSSAIVRLLRDPKLAARCVKNGYTVCKERFDVNNQIKRLERIYKSLIDH